MSSTMQAGAHPYWFLWTTAEAQSVIAARIKGPDVYVFYPSFLNWLNRHLERLGHHLSEPTEDEKLVFSTLSQSPIAWMDLLSLMARYADGDYVGGPLKNGLVRIEGHHPDKNIAPAQEQLHVKVWRLKARLEREQMLSSSNSTHTATEDDAANQSVAGPAVASISPELDMADMSLDLPTASGLSGALDEEMDEGEGGVVLMTHPDLVDRTKG